MPNGILSESIDKVGSPWKDKIKLLKPFTI